MNEIQVIEKPVLPKLNAEEFGMEQAEADAIAARFVPVIEEMIALEVEFLRITSIDGDPNADRSKEAKELRLRYVKLRKQAEKIHKQEKDSFLRGGRFVDSWKNMQTKASEKHEAELEKIEKFAEEQERQRQLKLQSERFDQFKPYMMPGETSPHFAVMDDQMFADFLAGRKARHEARIEGERLAAEAARKAEAENKAAREELAAARQREAELKAENEELSRIVEEVFTEKPAPKPAVVVPDAGHKFLERFVASFDSGVQAPSFPGPPGVSLEEVMLANTIKGKHDAFLAWARKQIAEFKGGER